MRTLHFRIWNGHSMEYNITVGKFGTFYVNPGAKGDGLNEKDTACLTEFNTKYDKDIHVMQFTGLTDKHGNRLYEGDIIEYSGIHSYDNSGTLILGWDGDDAGFGYSYAGEEVYSTSCFSDIVSVSEKVGNIYENPELTQ